MNTEDEEHSPDDAKDGERSPPGARCHAVELNGSQKGSYGYHYREPRVTEPYGG